MKIDRSKLKKSSSELPAGCKALKDKLKSCSEEELLLELGKIEAWTYGKCKLYQWVDVLDCCDTILEKACRKEDEHSWVLDCDLPQNEQKRLLWTLHFTTLLIKHSFSRHLYNSMEHLTTLLSSECLNVVTFVTRAVTVRVIDKITNFDMQSFQTHGGFQIFTNRLESEVNACCKEQVNTTIASTSSVPVPTEPVPGVTCLPHRASLLKSMLSSMNFLKKAIQHSSFSDSIRRVVNAPLSSSLKHIISNAEYYGPSLFLLGTDIFTVYVCRKPSLLSSLQDFGLTDEALLALLLKTVPATREVLEALPNVFSALCSDARGLASFVACKPFERLFKVLLSPDYLPAMRRRRSSGPMSHTATNLGNAMDELMRHQPSLRKDATAGIIKLLEELRVLGQDPNYMASSRAQKLEQTKNTSARTGPVEATGFGSSDEKENEGEETTSSSKPAPQRDIEAEPGNVAASVKTPVPQLV